MKTDSQSASVRWISVATTAPVLRRSVRVSLVVGTLLVAINQGNLLLAGVFPPDLIWKIPLTYCVPFSVSTYAAVDAILARQPCSNGGETR